MKKIKKSAFSHCYAASGMLCVRLRFVYILCIIQRTTNKSFVTNVWLSYKEYFFNKSYKKTVHSLGISLTRNKKKINEKKHI